MKTKTKSILIIVSTLFIGIALGFLISTRVIENRVDKYRRMQTKDGFQEKFYEIVEPTDEQKVLLNKVMEKFHSKFDNLRGEMKLNFDSLHTEMEKVLTEEQMKKLEERISSKRFRPFGSKEWSKDKRKGKNRHKKDSLNNRSNYEN